MSETCGTSFKFYTNATSFKDFYLCNFSKKFLLMPKGNWVLNFPLNRVNENSFI